jgi:hypothetical protein
LRGRDVHRCAKDRYGRSQLRPPAGSHAIDVRGFREDIDPAPQRPFRLVLVLELDPPVAQVGQTLRSQLTNDAEWVDRQPFLPPAAQDVVLVHVSVQDRVGLR